MRSLLPVFISLSFTVACSSEPATEPTPDASAPTDTPDAGSPADTRDSGRPLDTPDAGPVELPLCSPDVLMVRGELEAQPLELHSRWNQLGAFGADGIYARRVSVSSALGGDLLVLAQPTARATAEEEWMPARALVRADGRILCGGEGSRMAQPTRGLELDLEGLHDLGDCESAPPVEGSLSTRCTRMGCVVEGTIAGEPFSHEGGSDVLTVTSGGQSATRLGVDLTEGEGYVWARTVDDAVGFGVVYLSGRDGEDPHVYCIGEASISSESAWRIGGFRDLGTCAAAPAAVGSLDVCALRSAD
jgi:hypothetical protein